MGTVARSKHIKSRHSIIISNYVLYHLVDIFPHDQSDRAASGSATSQSTPVDALASASNLNQRVELFAWNLEIIS